MKYSILDQSPIISGSNASESLHATLELAVAADKWGYHRFWVAEHHSHVGLAGSCPEILISRLLGMTDRLRVGSGGTLLSHYSPLKVAETFSMLCHLYPGRVDLGLARGLITEDHLSLVLRGAADETAYEQKVRELINFMSDEFPHDHASKAISINRPSHQPPVWILSSGRRGAATAAGMGLPLAYAHFTAGDTDLLSRYRKFYRPSSQNPDPYVMLCLAVSCAETVAEAEANADVAVFWYLQIRARKNVAIPTLQSTTENLERSFASDAVRVGRERIVSGTPNMVLDNVHRLAAQHQADEVMLLTVSPTNEARMMSYELLASEFNATSVNTMSIA